MRIHEALRRFVVQLEADGRSRHTIGQYRRHLRLFARWARHGTRCGDRIERLGHQDVARFLASDEATVRPDGRRKKQTALNCLRGSLRVFLRYCRESGITRDDAGRLIRYARCAPPPPSGLSDDEQRRLLAVLGKARSPEGKRDAMLFELMLASGIRVGSAVALDVEDVHLECGELRLRTTKGDRPEVVFLNRTIQRKLAGYLRGRRSGPLFPARDRRVSIRHVQRRFAQWAEQAGIGRDVSCHSLRHSFAMCAYEKTGDILVVKELLRHRAISSTLVYARADQQRLRRAMR